MNDLIKQSQHPVNATARERVFIASDHAGFDLKENLKRSLPSIEWLDLGPSDSTSVDYPDFADRVASQVSSSDAKGVLICGSGQGMAMRANKHSRIRAALAWNEDVTLLAREHNDANILCLGARLITPELAVRLVQLFLSTPFAGGRHLNRVHKISAPLSSKPEPTLDQEKIILSETK